MYGDEGGCHAKATHADPADSRQRASYGRSRAAADLVGETLLVAFRRRYAYDFTRADALPWLYGIATTLVGQHRREEARRHRLQAALPVEPAEPFPADGVTERVAAAAVRRTLLDAVAALRPTNRTCCC